MCQPRGRQLRIDLAKHFLSDVSMSALLAALYAGLFLEPKFKRVIKPALEIMASLPSVVLGFIAALWLAPLLETRCAACHGEDGHGGFASDLLILESPR